MILSFSGIDGAGKSTQIDLLLRALVRKGQTLDLREHRMFEGVEQLHALRREAQRFDVIAVRFYLSSAETRLAQARVKRAGGPTAVRATVAWDAFSLALDDATRWRRLFVEPLLNAGRTLIFDRYAFDEVIYRTAEGLDPIELSRAYASFPTVDCAFLVDVRADVLCARNAVRADGAGMLFRVPNRLESLVDKFRRYAPLFGLTPVDGEASPEDVHRAVVHALETSRCGWRPPSA